MILHKRNALIAHLAFNVVSQPRLYVLRGQSMIKTMRNAWSAQMFTFAFMIRDQEFCNLLIAGATVRIRPCQPSWIFSLMPTDCQLSIINGALIATIHHY